MEKLIYLEHHGIRGMKWGIRRFQNPDGTWTPEGKERRRSESPIKKIKERINNRKEEINRRRKYPFSDTRSMTDEELDAKINRLRKERTLQKLEKELNEEDEDFVSRGVDVVSGLVKGPANGLVSTVIEYGITRRVKRALES